MRVSVAPDAPAPPRTPRRGIAPSIVSAADWCEANHDHLWHLFHYLQETNGRSGIYVFDAETCPFARFCAIAYQNSFKYSRSNAPDYESQ